MTGCSPGDIPHAKDTNTATNIATYLRDRATKYEHQGEAKKDLPNDFCFHLIHFAFLFWPSFGFLLWEVISGRSLR